MKNTQDIINETREDMDDLLNSQMSIGTMESTIRSWMILYAQELLNHLMENSHEYIYIDDGESGDYSVPEEAVFNYEAIEKLAASLK